MKDKKNKTNWGNVIFWFMIYLGIFFAGMVVGMGFQQRIFFIGLGEALSYSDIEVNVNMNETKMVDRIYENLNPFFNETIGNYPKCCYPLDCPQSVNNPKDCSCMFAIECYQDKLTKDKE